MPDLCFTPAYKLRRMLIERKISTGELLEVFIDQLHRCNPVINGLVTLDLVGARKRADEIDRHFANTHTKPLGPLHGLPIAVKDVFATQGIRTTLGNPLFADHIPKENDILVAREKAAGAVVLGKSNTPDCASGGRTTNEIFGLSRNPWDLEKTTSGSSGGAVAALMGGMVAIADGSDIGGSVRSPAAWTNCVGFRPSSGRLPGIPGALSDGDTSTAGVFARCIKDVSLFMEACDGPDLRSATSYPSGPAIHGDLLDQLPQGVQVAWSPDFADREMASTIVNLFEDHRSVFEKIGLILSGTELGLGEDYRKLYNDFDAYGHVKGLPAKVLNACLEGKQVKPSIQSRVDHYMSMSAKEIFQMFRAREMLRVKTQLYMQDHAVIITPAHNCLAYGAVDPVGESECDWSAFYLAPLLGLPSVVIPCGFTEDDMPHGVMITGRMGEDLLVLQIARAFERATGYWKTKPPLLVSR